MSTKKREPKRWEPGVVDFRTGKVRMHMSNIGEFVLYKDHEKIANSYAGLIQMAVNEMNHATEAAHECGWHGTVDRLVRFQQAAEAAGFKPQDHGDHI